MSEELTRTRMEMNEDVVIVGAGIAGLTTSLGLHRLGMKSLILESSESLRVSGYGLVMSGNAWRALDAVGVGDALRQHHPQIQGLQIIPMHKGVPNSITIPLLGEGKCGRREVRCVKRKSLLETLGKELPPGTIRYSSEVVSIQESGYFKRLHLADGSIIKAKVLIGCDGINSVVAKYLGLATTVSTQRCGIRGLAEFSNGHGFEPMFVQHIGEGYRYAYVPCDETYVYWFLTCSSSRAKDLKNHPLEIKQFLLDKLNILPPQIETMIQNTELNDLSKTTIKMRWPLDMLLGNMHKGNVCVAGDAFHPMTPDIGQGACSALEDAVVLARCLCEALKKNSDDQQEAEERCERIKKALDKYAKSRQWRSFLISSASYLTGKIQQSNGVVIGFLRKIILSRIMMNAQLKLADFDCGKLHCN